MIRGVAWNKQRRKNLFNSVVIYAVLISFLLAVTLFYPTRLRQSIRDHSPTSIPTIALFVASIVLYFYASRTNPGYITETYESALQPTRGQEDSVSSEGSCPAAPNDANHLRATQCTDLCEAQAQPALPAATRSSSTPRGKYVLGKPPEDAPLSFPRATSTRNTRNDAVTLPKRGNHPKNEDSEKDIALLTLTGSSRKTALPPNGTLPPLDLRNEGFFNDLSDYALPSHETASQQNHLVSSNANVQQQSASKGEVRTAYPYGAPAPSSSKSLPKRNLARSAASDSVYDGDEDDIDGGLLDSMHSDPFDDLSQNESEWLTETDDESLFSIPGQVDTRPLLQNHRLNHNQSQPRPASQQETSQPRESSNGLAMSSQGHDDFSVVVPGVHAESSDALAWPTVIPSYQLRFCRVCRVMQPMRTKHCLQCKRCVRKYDHHCPFVGQCVGERNHGYFLLFILSHFVSGCKIFIELNRCLLSRAAFDTTWHFLQSQIILWIAFGITGFGTAAVFVLLCIHAYLMMTGSTTWEQMSRERISYFKVLPVYINPFDQGIFANVFMFFFPGKRGVDWEDIYRRVLRRKRRRMRSHHHS